MRVPQGSGLVSKHLQVSVPDYAGQSISQAATCLVNFLNSKAGTSCGTLVLTGAGISTGIK